MVTRSQATVICPFVCISITPPYQKSNRGLQLSLIQLLLSNSPTHLSCHTLVPSMRNLNTGNVPIRTFHRRLQGRCRVVTLPLRSSTGNSFPRSDATVAL